MNYVLEFETFKAVLKVAKQEQSRLHNAIQFLQLAQKSPYLPELLWYEPTHFRSLVERFIDGEHLYHLNVKQAQQLAQALHFFHSVPPNSDSQPDESPCIFWEHYYQTRLLTQFEIARANTPQVMLQQVSKQLDHIQQYGSSTFNQYLEEKKPNPVFVHTDLIPLNIIFTPQQCVIIDLELVRRDFLEWDICSVLKSFQFTPESLDAFYAAYQNPIDKVVLSFVSILHYCNVALWRMCAFYARNEIQGDITSREFFLTELSQELDWVDLKLRDLVCAK